MTSQSYIFTAAQLRSAWFQLSEKENEEKRTDDVKFVGSLAIRLQKSQIIFKFQENNIYHDII